MVPLVSLPSHPLSRNCYFPRRSHFQSGEATNGVQRQSKLHDIDGYRRVEEPRRGHHPVAENPCYYIPERI